VLGQREVAPSSQAKTSYQRSLHRSAVFQSCMTAAQPPGKLAVAGGAVSGTSRELHSQVDKCKSTPTIHEKLAALPVSASTEN
jgi:hypothetical protein